MYKIGLMMIAAVSMSACSRVPGRYELPADQIYARLANNELNDFKLARQCGLLLYVHPDGVPNRSVTWTVTTGNVDVAKFGVVLTPISSSETQVDIQIEPLPNGHLPYDGTQVEYRPAFRQPLQPAIEEAIASAIEQRAFDPSRFDQHEYVSSAQDSAELNKHKQDVVNANAACLVQRGSLEIGNQPFSIHDSPSSYGH